MSAARPHSASPPDIHGPVGERADSAFSGGEYLRVAGLCAAVGLLHVLGWGLYFAYARQYPALLGLGVAAYMFGLRHAFDADHISAIDDSVRYLLQKRKKPLGISFFFLVLMDILKVWRHGHTHVEELLSRRGIMNRLFGGRLQTAINHSWQMYPVGLFLLAWGLSMTIWKFGRMEQRYGLDVTVHSHEHIHESGMRHTHKHLH